MLSKPFAPVALAALTLSAVAAGVVLPAPAEAAQAGAAFAAPTGQSRAHAFQSAAAPGWPILPANLRAPQGVRLGASGHRLRHHQRLSAAQLRRLRIAQHRQAVVRWRLGQASQLRHRQALRLARLNALRLAHAPAWGRRLQSSHVAATRVVPTHRLANLPDLPRGLTGRVAPLRVPGAQAAVGAAQWDASAQAFVVPVQGNLPAGKLSVVRLNDRWSYLDIPAARPNFGGVAWDSSPAPGVDRWVMAAQPRLRATRVSIACTVPTGWTVERRDGALLVRPDSAGQLAAAPRVPARLSLTPSALPKLAGPVGPARSPKATPPLALASALVSRPASPVGAAGVPAHEGAGAPAAADALAPTPQRALAPAPERGRAQAAPGGSSAPATEQAPTQARPALAHRRSEPAAHAAVAPQTAAAPVGAAPDAAVPTAAVAADPSPPTEATLADRGLNKRPGHAARDLGGKPELTVLRASRNPDRPSAWVPPTAPQGDDALARALDDGDTRLEAAEPTREGHLALRFQGRTPSFRLQRTSATTASLTFPASSLRQPGVHTLAPEHHPTLQEGVVQQQGAEVRVDLRLTQEGRVGVYVDRSQKRLVVVMDGAPPAHSPPAEAPPSAPAPWTEPASEPAPSQPAS